MDCLKNTLEKYISTFSDKKNYDKNDKKTINSK